MLGLFKTCLIAPLKFAISSVWWCGNMSKCLNDPVITELSITSYWNSQFLRLACAYVCVCMCVCVCIYIFFHCDGLFHLQVFRDILEGTDKQSCVVNINLGASAKFLHLGIWKCHISTPKTKLQPADNCKEAIWYIRVTKRWYILI